MKLTPKILVATVVLISFSALAEAKNLDTNTPDYTIRKDSSAVAVDTNKKVVLFPNPFNIIIYSDEKR